MYIVVDMTNIQKLNLDSINNVHPNSPLAASNQTRSVNSSITPRSSLPTTHLNSHTCSRSPLNSPKLTDAKISPRIIELRRDSQPPIDRLNVPLDTQEKKMRLIQKINKSPVRLPIHSSLNRNNLPLRRLVSAGATITQTANDTNCSLRNITSDDHPRTHVDSANRTASDGIKSSAGIGATPSMQSLRRLDSSPSRLQKNNSGNSDRVRDCDCDHK